MLNILSLLSQQKLYKFTFKCIYICIYFLLYKSLMGLSTEDFQTWKYRTLRGREGVEWEYRFKEEKWTLYYFLLLKKSSLMYF